LKAGIGLELAQALRALLWSMDRMSEMPEIGEPSPRTRTTLLKLRAQQCRFIVSNERSEAIFCGGETQAGSSWCPWHRRLVYASSQAGGRELSRSMA
jgi:hypothetical protein